MHQSMEVVLVAPKDGPPHTTGGLLPKSQMLDRFSTFNRGQWINLLIMSQDCSERASQAQCRRRRTHQNDSLERRAERAEALVQIGELSAGRRALEGAPLAPGNMATLRELQNPLRRPPVPRSPMAPIVLEQDLFLKNLKCARRGAAGGPSGLTSEH